MLPSLELARERAYKYLKNTAIVHSSQSSPKSIDALLLQDKIYDELISSQKGVVYF